VRAVDRVMPDAPARCRATSAATCTVRITHPATEGILDLSSVTTAINSRGSS